MIVHKFGGTSIGNAERIARVAEIIRKYAQGDERPVVVVSALSGVTDRLIAGARAAAAGREAQSGAIGREILERHLATAAALLPDKPGRRELFQRISAKVHELERLYASIAVLGEVTRRGLDAVSACGEHLSAPLVAAVLQERGLPARAVSATRLVVTDSRFGAAAPNLERTRARLIEAVTPLVSSGVIPVITGYIGADEAGATTTLGRGGSDFSAALIAAGLEADEVWIWSDVNGILTADPHWVPEAQTLEELSYEEAAELADYGAEVLHPKTIRPVIAGGIPLRLMNSFNPQHPGTRIVAAPRPERRRLPAIISTTGLSLIALGGRNGGWSLDAPAQALQRLNDAGLDVLMFSQSFSEHSLNLVVRQEDQPHCLDVLCRAFGSPAGPNCGPDRVAGGLHDGSYRLGLKEKVATVSLVGVPGWNGGSPVAQAFGALGRAGTRVIAVAQAASESSISFCIPEESAAETVRALHRELGIIPTGPQSQAPF